MMSLDLMADLLQWCRNRREQDRYRLDMMRAGKIRVHQDDQDVTEGEIARLQDEIARIAALIARLEPQNTRLR
jgi:hypothetical protein